MGILFALLQSILLFAISNIYIACIRFDFNVLAIYWMIIIGFGVFITINIVPTIKKQASLRTKSLRSGTRLLIVFLYTTVFNLLLLLEMIFMSKVEAKHIIINSIIVFLVELVLFWNGIIRVYCTSIQLGIKWRVLGAIFGMFPIVNLFFLAKIICISYKEYKFEQEKAELDNIRAQSNICSTKYPLLMVHGVFFRDYKFFNYWGRIPAALKKNGATINYGLQQSAASVPDSGKELAARIKQIIIEKGCDKVNIIAHSKGGLDSRYAISLCDCDEYVASLTTINTPHRGCMFADYLLEKVSEKLLNSVAKKYNVASSFAGDKQPDFKAAVKDLTANRCKELNNIMPDSRKVYYQSIGSKSVKATGGKFPLNFSYLFVKRFDGENDGLVAIESMKWGENFKELVPNKKRGITHGDMIDLGFENIDGFDVREAYVEIVSDLKNKGF